MKSFLPNVNVVLSMLLLSLTCLAQTSKNDFVTNLYKDLDNDEKLVAECLKKQREYQLSKFGRILPEISGHCWSGCPTLIVKPSYPIEAQRLNIKGEVKIEAIVDENLTSIRDKNGTPSS